MRPVHDPYGGVNPLIDKMIGNAYDVVKYVARYLKEIRYIAENMGTVYSAVHGSKIFFSGVPEMGDSDIQFQLDEDVNLGNIENISVIAVATNGNMYFPDPNTFNFGVDTTGLITVSFDDGNPDLVTATYRVVVTSTPPK